LQSEKGEPADLLIRHASDPPKNGDVAIQQRDAQPSRAVILAAVREDHFSELSQAFHPLW
jgi:hypothetical protein